jgi:hypothetical protein
MWHTFTTTCESVLAEESSEAHHRERGQSIEERVLKGYVFELCHRRPNQRGMRGISIPPDYWTARLIMAVPSSCMDLARCCQCYKWRGSRPSSGWMRVIQFPICPQSIDQNGACCRYDSKRLGDRGKPRVLVVACVRTASRRSSLQAVTKAGLARRVTETSTPFMLAGVEVLGHWSVALCNQ